jgi:hypothetical protein
MQIDLISTDMLREAHAQFYIGPRMVLSASGVDHADLVALATKYFSVCGAGRDLLCCAAMRTVCMTCVGQMPTLKTM